MRNINPTLTFIIKMIILIALMIAATLPFSSCRKLNEYINTPTEETTCRIARIIQDDTIANEVRTGIVYYNSHNNPDSVIFETQVYGPVYFYFNYDENNRLIEYKEMYSREPGDYYAWHKYIYENGIIVQDTARGRIAGQSTTVKNIEYDANGRVARETGKLIEVDNYPFEEEIQPIIYTYDSNGNIGDGRYVYDRKISFLRTNKIWMFTQRNYSMNNIFGAATYNEYGLPLKFEPNKTPYFLLAYAGITRIEYECDGR